MWRTGQFRGAFDRDTVQDAEVVTRLTELIEHKARKSKEATAYNQKIERVQKHQLPVERVEKIELKSVPLSSKVMLDSSKYESLAKAAKK